LVRASAASDEFLAQADFALYPRADHLLSTRVRAGVQQQAQALVTSIYTRLHAHVADPAQQYGEAAASPLLRRSPAQLASLFG
jgi:hypothetical protein